MKAKLEFDLDEHDDKMSHLRCIKSLDMALILWEIRVNMRKRLEHEAEARSIKNPGTDYYAGVDLAMDFLDELFDEHDLGDMDQYVN